MEGTEVVVIEGGSGSGGSPGSRDCITLISTEGVQFELSRTAVKHSELVYNMIEDGTVNEVPLVGVKSEVLTKITEWLRYYDGKETPPLQKPLKTEHLKDFLPDWDVTFINSLPYHILFDLVLATHYMAVKPLLDLAISRIAAEIKGKSIDDLKKQFVITKDFTAEEEAQVREENKWIEEN